MLPSENSDMDLFMTMGNSKTLTIFKELLRLSLLEKVEN